jgi:hypothetical protein
LQVEEEVNQLIFCLKFVVHFHCDIERMKISRFYSIIKMKMTKNKL